jgi:copper chaperone CopZ
MSGTDRRCDMSTTRETLLQVDGMSCSSCVRHIDRALRSVDGVRGIEVRLKDRRVVVTHDGSAPVDELVEAVREAGYEARAA